MTDENQLDPFLPDDDDGDGDDGPTPEQLAEEAFRTELAQQRMHRDDMCRICGEHIPTTKDKLFGLQQNCYHKFHFSCVCAWRKENWLKECPACKVRSPSVYMWPEYLGESDREYKAELFDNFLQGVWARQLFGVLDVVFTLFLEDYRFFWMIIITIVLLLLGWMDVQQKSRSRGKRGGETDEEFKTRLEYNQYQRERYRKRKISDLDGAR